MRISLELLKEIEKYCSDRLKKESSEKLVYHTIDHTWQIVKNAEIIGSSENLSEEEMKILLTSAWFHDLGYINKSQGHEEESMAIHEFSKVERG